MRIASVVCLALAATSLIACTSSPDVSEEDAAADAYAGGKSDALGFPLGPFTREPDYENNEPLIAVFHAPDGSAASTENGPFDLVMFEEDESTYDVGTYKLYKYRGRDRIRFTDADGRVLLRADWSYADNTLTLGEHELWQPRQLPEELVDCLAVDVLDNNVFEEGLSTQEYPSVSVDREGDLTSLHIGGSIYDSTEAAITVDDGAAGFEATATLEGGDKMIIRVPNEAPRRGEVVQVTEGEESSVATIVCR